MNRFHALTRELIPVLIGALVFLAGAAFVDGQTAQTASGGSTTQLVARAIPDAYASDAVTPGISLIESSGTTTPVRSFNMVMDGEVAPFPGLASSLDRKGITPILNVVQFWLGDPHMGQEPGHWTEQTLLTSGADLDMQKIAGYKGASIHFTEMFVPTTHNTAGYGNQVGDAILGQAGPFIPFFPHLTRFTWEEKAFNSRLDLETGKGNTGAWYVLPVCLVPFGCASALAQYDGGFGQEPPPYGNWLARAAYSFSPAMTVQVSEYRSTANFPWTNGWELQKTTIHGGRPDSNVYLADFSYRTDYQTDKYPKNYEFAFAHNTALQEKEQSTGGGVTLPVADFHHGTNIMYAAGRQVVYRLDGAAPTSTPKALSLYGQLTQSFDMKNVSGLETDVKTGVLAEGLFKSRPHDGYSLKFTWVRVTNDLQEYMNTANLAAGGAGYHNPRNEFGLGPEASFPFKGLIFMPFGQRVWNPNTMMNPSFGGTVKAGWGYGVMMIWRLDGVLGLVRP
jgi:porin